MRFSETGAKVDPRHEARVAALSWQRNQNGYLRHYKKVTGKTKNMFAMHQYVWFLEHGEWVKGLDHINGDPTDNRLENLRKVTRKTKVAVVKVTKASSEKGTNQESLQAALDFFGAAVVSEDLATQLSEAREERGCVAVAAVAGGKHAATVPPGDLTLSSDQIMDAWHQAWGQA
jgi:hypothetical protein